MFIHNINPVLLQIGPLAIRYYGLVYAIGFLFAYLFFIKKYKEVKNLKKNDVENLILYLILGVIIGARLLLFVFYDPSVFWTNPLQIFKIWEGGMSFHGGLIGGILIIWWFSRKHKINFYEITDLLTIPVAIMLGIGRIANFINGELYGTLTNVSWCFKFPAAEGCRHPSQLYEMAKNFFIAGFLAILKTKKSFVPGVLTWIFVLMYGILRFIVNFWREETRWLGISMGQYLCLGMIVVSVFFLIRLHKSHTKSKK